MTATITSPIKKVFSSNGAPYLRDDIQGFLYNTPQGSWLMYIGDESKGGGNDPNYRVKLAKGQNCTNGYSLKRINWSFPKESSISQGLVIDSPEYLKKKFARGMSTQDITVGLSCMSLAPSDAAYADIANKRIKSRAASQINQFQALVPLAELRELRGLIRGSASLTSRLIPTLIGIKTKRGRREAWKYASEAWLTYSFGVSPMIADTKKVCDSISTYLDRENFSSKITGTSLKKWQSTWNGQYTGSYGTTAYIRADVQHELMYKYLAGIDYKIESGNNYGINQHFGLEMSQLPLVMWELTAFSWVVDYFSTVGEYLEDVFTADAYQTKYCLQNRKYTAKATFSGYHKPGPGFTVNGTISGPTCEYFEFARTPLSALPTRSLRLKTQDAIGQNAVTKLLNLASLLLK